MAESLSLKELKAQNALKDEAKQDAPIENTQEEVVSKPVEQAKPIEAATVDTPDEDDLGEDTEVEGWMQTEEAETSESDQNNWKPNHEAAKRRKQAKALKGELKEKGDENSQLKARIAELETGTPQVQSKPELPPRPTREQFDYDDDAYDAAVDDWNDKRFDAKLNNHSQTSQQKQSQESQQNQMMESRTKAINGHYERAQSLVESGKVSAENYQAADAAVRQAVEQAFPGQGDATTETLIAMLDNLGEGGEKVIYQLGVNESSMAKFKSLLNSDKSGFAVSAYLGELRAQTKSPTKRRSQAPTPGSSVNGESGNGGKGGTLQKAYSKETDVGKRISMKRQAKKQGVDVTKW